MIHRYDDGFFRITVHDSFQTNFFSSHNNNNLPSAFTRIIVQNQRAYSIPEIIPVIKAKEAKKAKNA